MIQQPIKILLVEDNEADALLIERQIKKIVANPSVVRVDEFDEFIITLERFSPDIILCDFSLNGFNGFEVLKFINNSSYYIPLVFITGAINDEELAANSILSGASGYILKKNINKLHEKLLPHFKRIEDLKKDIPINSERALKIEQLQNYLEKLKRENTVNMHSYNEIKRALDRLINLLD